MFKRIIVLAVGFLAMGPIACSKKAKSEHNRSETASAQTAAAQPAAPSDPASVFKAKCVVCHGDTGKGDGPGAASLDPKPRAFNDPEWQQEMSDEAITRVILKGGAAVGKSVAMPPNPDLKNKPEVVAGLVELIRNFK